VIAQGSAYSQFKRALKRQNFMLAWTMAAESPRCPLPTGWSCCSSPGTSSRRDSTGGCPAGMRGFAPSGSSRRGKRS